MIVGQKHTVGGSRDTLAAFDDSLLHRVRSMGAVELEV